jgi:hypothetical protein
VKISVEELKSKAQAIKDKFSPPPAHIPMEIQPVTKQKMKFTLAFQVEYDVDPTTYTDPDPKKMGEEDTASAEDNPFVAFQAMMKLPEAKVRVKCEAVETVAQKAGFEIQDVKVAK